MPWNENNSYKRIVFTANVPAGKTHSDFNLEMLRIRQNPSYMICGRETAGTGQLHFQGYMEFAKKRRGKTIMEAFATWGIKAHLEPAMGSAQQNKDYCTKEDKEAFEFGEPSGGQGARSDLAELAKMAKAGASDAELLEANPGGFLVHQKGLRQIRNCFAQERTGPSNLLFLWGPSGTGKTSAAYEIGVENIDRCKISGKRFLQGYTRERETVLFDDFNWEGMTALDFLEITDRWPATMDVKNGEVRFAPKNIIFTSNYDPMTWWPDAPEPTREAIRRRIEEFGEVRYMGDPIPRGQKPTPKLTDFFAKINQATPGARTGAGASEPKPADSGDVVDLTEDTEDFENSLEARDWDAHSDISNVDFAEARGRRIVEHDRAAKRIRLGVYVAREW